MLSHYYYTFFRFINVRRSVSNANVWVVLTNQSYVAKAEILEPGWDLISPTPIHKHINTMDLDRFYNHDDYVMDKLFAEVVHVYSKSKKVWLMIVSDFNISSWGEDESRRITDDAENQVNSFLVFLFIIFQCRLADEERSDCFVTAFRKDIELFKDIKVGDWYVWFILFI